MTKLVILVLIAVLSTALFGQKGIAADAAVNSCSGAVNIFQNGSFQLQFTGLKSDAITDAYPSLSGIQTENQLWLSFIAPRNGAITFNAAVESGFIQMVVFKEEVNNVCSEIERGMAEIQRMYAGTDQASVGLDYEIGGGVLYALEVQEGQHYQILLATTEKVNEKLFLDWEFVSKVAVHNEIAEVDKRTDDFAPTFQIKVRDKETNLPLLASVSIEGSRNLDALYTGTDFLFNLDRNSRLNILCDVEGYFFVDIKDTSVSATEDFDLTIQMEQIRAGKSLVIQDIEFTPGTSEITMSSEPKLRRLKDFLALNSNLSIEIQGHVFALGDNSLAGQKISEARAKRVMVYLIENGIDKSRLNAVGYGNTRPIYPDPRFSYEEQANRRVEILVL